MGCTSIPSQILSSAHVERRAPGLTCECTHYSSGKIDNTHMETCLGIYHGQEKLSFDSWLLIVLKFGRAYK